MKKILTLLLFIFPAISFAQFSYPNLNVSNLLGVPQSASPSIGTATNTIKYLIYNTTTGTLQVYNGSTWVDVFPSGNYVDLTSVQTITGKKTITDNTNGIALTVAGNGTALDVTGYAAFRGGGDFDILKNTNMSSGFATTYFSGASNSDIRHAIVNTSTGLRLYTDAGGVGGNVEVRGPDIVDGTGNTFIKTNTGDARYLRLAGGTMAGNVLLGADNTYTIGAAGGNGLGRVVSFIFSSNGQVTLASNGGGAMNFNTGGLTRASISNAGIFTYTTAAAGDNSTQVATTAYVDRNLSTLAIVSTINAKNTGTTALYTVPTGKTAIITSTYIRCTAATAITVGPSVDIGVTAGDIYPNTALTTLNAANKQFGFFSTGIAQSPTAGQTVNLNINTAATGTSMTIEVIMLGILR